MTTIWQMMMMKRLRKERYKVKSLAIGNSSLIVDIKEVHTLNINIRKGNSNVSKVAKGQEAQFLCIQLPCL